MNQPANSQNGWAALAGQNGLLNYLAGGTSGDTFFWDGTKWGAAPGELVFIADNTGATRVGAQLQALLNRCVPGQGVYVPRGKYDTSDVQLNIPAGVTLRGPYIGHCGGSYQYLPNPLDVSAQLWRRNTAPEFGSSSLAAITLNQGSRIRDIEGYYPDQKTNSAPDVYGPFIRVVHHRCHVENITSCNAYFLLLIGSLVNDGVAPGGITISNIWGLPLWKGMHFGRTPDVDRVANVQFNGVQFLGSTLRDWVAANGTAFVLDGTEGIHFYGCFAFRYNIGIQLKDVDGDGFDNCTASFHGGGFDTCNTPVLVDEPNGFGSLSLFGTVLTPTGSTSAAIEFQDTSVPVFGDSQRPTVYAFGCPFIGGGHYGCHMHAGSYGVMQVVGGQSWGHSSGTDPVFYSESANTTIDLRGGHRIEAGTRPRVGGLGKLFDDCDGKLFSETDFGDGSDGDLIVSSGDTILTSDRNYRNVTISGTARVFTSAFTLRISGTLDLTNAGADAIVTNRNNGTNAVGATPGTRGTAFTAATTGVGGPGSDGAAGTTGAGAQSTAPTAQTPANGGAGGSCGTGGTTGGNAGGASAAGGTVANAHYARNAHTIARGMTLSQGGAGGRGGSSGGGDGTNAGGAGGGGGAGGLVNSVIARRIVRAATTAAGAISAGGGDGGNGAAGVAGNASGGSGAGGGGGGYPRVVAGELIGTAAPGAITANGGKGGNGGAAAGTGQAGTGATGGNSGAILVGELCSGTWTLTTGTAGSAPSGITGGQGGTCSATL